MGCRAGRGALRAGSAGLLQDHVGRAADRMRYRCDIAPLDLRDGGLTTLIHVARVRHQLDSCVSELPGPTRLGLGSARFDLGVWTPAPSGTGEKNADAPKRCSLAALGSPVLIGAESE